MKTKYPNKKVAIFDIDGTLINSKPKLNSDVKRAFYNLGYNLANEDIENSKNWYELAEQYGITRELFDKEFNKRKTWEQSLKDGEAPLFEDSIPCLERLYSEGVILGVLTKSTLKYTNQKLDFHKLRKYFEDRVAVTNIDEKSKRKEAISLINKINPTTVNSAYFIGDQIEDVIVEKDVQSEYELNTKGIWLNRNNKKIPKKLISYQQINSLEKLSLII